MHEVKAGSATAAPNMPGTYRTAAAQTVMCIDLACLAEESSL
jgi:hypothetical protein